MNRSRLLRGAAALALVLASTGAGLLVVEMTVRAFARRPALIFRPDPHLGWAHVPGIKITHLGHSGPNPVEINSHGLRDREIPYVKPKGTHRVLVLGDSYPEAVDVALEDSFPKQLESILNASAQEPWEVLNAGVGSYGTDQELLYLTGEGLTYSPDIVLLAFTIDNDLFNNLERGYCSLSGSEAVCGKTIGSSLKRLRFILESKSRAVDFLSNRARMLYRFQPFMRTLGLAKYEDSDRGKRALSPSLRMLMARPDTQVESGWALTRAILRKMHAECSKAGARLVIVLVPERIQESPSELLEALRASGVPEALTDIDRPNAVLREFGRQEKILVIDPLPLFQKARAQGVVLSKGHWTSAGHRLAAEVIASSLAP